MTIVCDTIGCILLSLLVPLLRPPPPEGRRRRRRWRNANVLTSPDHGVTAYPLLSPLPSSDTPPHLAAGRGLVQDVDAEKHLVLSSVPILIVLYTLTLMTNIYAMSFP